MLVEDGTSGLGQRCSRCSVTGCPVIARLHFNLDFHTRFAPVLEALWPARGRPKFYPLRALPLKMAGCESWRQLPGQLFPRVFARSVQNAW